MDIRKISLDTTEGSRFSIQYEQAATKGILGFKISANGDDLEQVTEQSEKLLQRALQKSSLYTGSLPEVKNGI